MMSRAGNVLLGLMALVRAILFPQVCIAQEDNQHCTYSCGDMHDIKHPFRLKGDPPKCGNPLYELACEHNRTILNLYGRKFYVQKISYNKKTMRVVDANIDQDSCSLPRNSLTNSNFNCSDPYWVAESSASVILINCTKPVNSPSFVDVAPCTNKSFSPKANYYAYYGYLLPSDVPHLCTIQFEFPALVPDTTYRSIFYFHDEFLKGFDLSYDYACITFTTKMRFQFFFTGLRYYLFSSPGYHRMFGDKDHFFRWGSTIYFYRSKGWVASIVIKGFILERTSLGILFLIAFSIYKFRRRHLSVDDTIEEFLQSHNNFMPIRYSYSQIKEMTKGFKDKLGQGGYGSVYKGKVRSGHLVAVKVLGMSKANGQDFINEVATIGRIHHVNVVRLTGFCVEGSKRALIYDFMPNGSLDKFIFREGEQINPLNWEKMYEIGLGVARGIEYLHRGCDMQILHFDIKPHNILLDEKFIPKISDFGLAKLYPIDNSIVSLTAARGTLGYIAPELIYKNIGGISYKADVYSYGMLLIEMVGKRKNVNAFAEHSSQIYFPSWVYDRISQDEDIELGDASEDEQKIARKMIIVALWCIQLKPLDRPSMNEVLEMLEGEVEFLQMPPKPFLYPKEMSIVDHADISPRGTLVSSHNDVDTITVDVS